MACVNARVHCLYSPLFLRSLAPALTASPHHGLLPAPGRLGPSTDRKQLHRSCVAQAQPSKKGPDKTVKIYCAKCQEQLYKYKKGGKGSLVKCFVERIVEDATEGDLKCPECGTEFARPAMIRGKPANKIIGGKVIMRK